MTDSTASVEFTQHQPSSPEDCPTPRKRLSSRLATLGAVWVCLSACASESPKAQPDITVGVSLPFTGKEAALGRNIEQAMLLAVQDVNSAGGVDGQTVGILSRDSNSGTERGFNDLLDLMYDQQVRYLVGPEENELASKVVPDIKKLDILNVLPGLAAPSIARSSLTGAWLRLAPSAQQSGCGLAGHAIDDGARTANALASQEDYNASVKTSFVSHFRAFEGNPVSSVSIQSGQSSYKSELSRVASFGADRTLLVAYPATAANIVNEWAVTRNSARWYLSPLLRTEAFLLNIPNGALDGEFGLSPSRSLVSECESLGDNAHGAVNCSHENSDRFTEHFAARWEGAHPFSASIYYYDAIVLLAAGIQYGLAKTGEIPDAKGLHKMILSLNDAKNEPRSWHELSLMFQELSQGKLVRYVGAAAEYDFDPYGAAEHRVFDTWTIQGERFIDTGAYYAHCTAFD